MGQGSLSRGKSKILAHSARGKLKRAVTSMSMARKLKSAQEANEDAKTRFFRPEKWKIMLTFFQIFSQYSSVYEIPWPEKVLEYMRIFKLFNLDFLKLVAFDCVIEGNLYQSFVITAFIPILAVVWIGICLVIGRIRYGAEIKKFPRFAADGTKLTWQSARSAYKKSEKRNGLRNKSRGGKLFAVQQVEIPRLPLLIQLPVPSFAQGKQRNAPANVMKMNIIGWHNRLKVRIRYEQFVDKVQHLFFIILLLAYVPVSGKVMRIFRCLEGGQKYYIMTDLQLECYTAEYNVYASIAVACIFLYIVGIPLLFFILLLNARNAGIAKIWKNIRNNDNRKQFWLAHAKAEKAAQNELWQDPKTEKETKRIIITYMKKTNLRSHKAQARFGFICEAYKEKAWWFECLELTRKLALTGGVALISPGSITQILAGLSFTAFYSYFAMNFKPYVEFSDDLLYNVCLFQLFSVLFIGLLTKLNVSPLQSKYDDIRVDSKDPADLRAAAGNPEPDDFLPWVVIFTHMACMVFALLCIVNEMRTAKRYQKAKRQRELEQEMKQLNELKEANKHITETDDSQLNDAQRELKEFLMESQHEVSRRKEALKKQVDNLQKEIEESAEKFKNHVNQQKSKQHERLMARLKKRQHKKGSAMANAVSNSIVKKVKNTKVLPVKSNAKRGVSKAPPPPPPPKKR